MIKLPRNYEIFLKIDDDYLNQMTLDLSSKPLLAEDIKHLLMRSCANENI